jgi:thiamine-phosphate pyrophosphorylase
MRKHRPEIVHGADRGATGETPARIEIVFPPLYAIIDAGLRKTSELAFAEMLAQSGVEILQYRNKNASSRDLFNVCSMLAREWPRLASGPGKSPRFVVNDRADIAALVNAGGVHVGQTDLGVEQAREFVGPQRWVGISTHNLEQVTAADRTSADYIAFGPIFATTTKANPDPVVGLELLAQARGLTAKPLVAIGGITLERAESVYRAGADSLAVTRDLLAAPDPGTQAQAYLQIAAQVQSAKRGRTAPL